MAINTMRFIGFRINSTIEAFIVVIAVVPVLPSSPFPSSLKTPQQDFYITSLSLKSS